MIHHPLETISDVDRCTRPEGAVKEFKGIFSDQVVKLLVDKSNKIKYNISTASIYQSVPTVRVHDRILLI